MRSWHVPALIAALLLMASLVALPFSASGAATNTALVTGKVVDQNGAGLAGINVVLAVNGNVANKTVTNLDGSYQMRVAAGAYSLIVNDKTVNGSVVVSAGQTLDLGSTQIYSTKNYAWIVIDITIVVGGFVLLLVARNRQRIKQRLKK
jgi:hypothetical protein